MTLALGLNRRNRSYKTENWSFHHPWQRYVGSAPSAPTANQLEPSFRAGFCKYFVGGKQHVKCSRPMGVYVLRIWRSEISKFGAPLEV